MRVAVTGSSGFLGKNLSVRLKETEGIEVLPLSRKSGPQELAEAVSAADALVHLAGVNRPSDEAEFVTGNVEFTTALCAALEGSGRTVPLIFASSVKAVDTTSYGASKAEAERVLFACGERTGMRVCVYRLANVFGKWCRPNYNSVVATFCHNVANDLSIDVHDASSSLTLVYIDDVVDEFVRTLRAQPAATGYCNVSPVYQTTLGVLADTIRRFRCDRRANMVGGVGCGLTRALYATYVSYLAPDDFSYPLKPHEDSRGSFFEFLKTAGSGQISVFTAHPGVTRGGHYHHTKSEKFLIVQGNALFRFRQILTGTSHEIRVSASVPTVVETVPGWAHDVTNVGAELLIAMLWANENFEPNRPDTVPHRV